MSSDRTVVQGRYELAGELATLLADTGEGDRRVVAVAGPPASGKSTLCQWLADQLSADETVGGAGASAVVGMDGFHFDNRVLAARGWSDRKGAPHTFDTGGLASTLERIKRNDEPFVAVPAFDRSIEMSRAAALLVDQQVRLVIVEGNYLLSGQPGWRDLHQQFDATIMVEVAEPVLRQRLVKRWIGYGFTQSEAEAKADNNDLPNARYVVTHSVIADWKIDNAAD